MSEIQKYKHSLSQRLSGYYPDAEAEQMARLLLEEAYGMPYPRLALSDDKVSEKCAKVEEWMAELLQLLPIQYVLGYSTFQGMKLMVRQGVLIPRGETEQLCQLIEDKGYLNANMTTADLCTGSGAIALFLAQKGCKVEAVDVSHEALSVAEENFRIYDIDQRIFLREENLLSSYFKPHYPLYDLVVSNPPYVLESEREGIKPHVLSNEPALALFVPDDHALKFYEAILCHYHGALVEGGRFAFEINPLVVDELVGLFSDSGYEVEVEKDYLGRQRFLFAQKK